MSDDQTPAFLTTKEIAGLLRVKERKVYDLVAAEEIPYRRITGKLLFPAAEISRWIEGEAGEQDRPRPAVLTGSHDPLLDWAIRESDCGLATRLNGSRDGLALFVAREAAACGMHIPDAGGWNIEAVRASLVENAVLLAFASRTRGLLLGPGLKGQIKGIGDLKGRVVVQRQAGAGAQSLLLSLLSAEGLSLDDLKAGPAVARTEMDAAAAIASGEAEAALGLEAMARQFKLDFQPLVSERFDLLIGQRDYFTEPWQRLWQFLRTDKLRRKAEALGGYDLDALGKVRWLSA